MLTLSFIDQIILMYTGILFLMYIYTKKLASTVLIDSILACLHRRALTIDLTYGIHHLLQRLLGYLILFVLCAFVLQRQFLHRVLPSHLQSPFGIIKFHLSSSSTALLHKTLVK